MALTRLQRDLDRYTNEKLQKCIEDVVQSFDIAGQDKSMALGSIGAACLRMAGALAVHGEASKSSWLRICSITYDQSLNAHRESEED
jgi:hypothetical protein